MLQLQPVTILYTEIFPARGSLATTSRRRCPKSDGTSTALEPPCTVAIVTARFTTGEDTSNYTAIT